MRWAVTPLSTASGSVHLTVRPLDVEALLETCWRSAPSRLCGRTAAAPSGWCEACTHALAAVLTYTEVVERWREQGRLDNRLDGAGA